MKKLPKINQFDLNKDIHNNKQVFNSLEEKTSQNVKRNDSKEKEKNSNLTVKDKIKKLIKANNYIFNTEVTLVYEDKEKKCHIAGVVNNHIITMNNEIIKIDDLKDIIY